jgi:hypothetical protein
VQHLDLLLAARVGLADIADVDQRGHAFLPVTKWRISVTQLARKAQARTRVMVKRCW